MLYSTVPSCANEAHSALGYMRLQIMYHGFLTTHMNRQEKTKLRKPLVNTSGITSVLVGLLALVPKLIKKEQQVPKIVH